MTNPNSFKSMNPLTHEVLGTFPIAQSEEIKNAFRKAQTAQKIWKDAPLKLRRRRILDLRELIINEKNEIAELISKETGKPEIEALSSEILPTIHALTYYAHFGACYLKPKNIFLLNPLFWHKKSTVYFEPLGVVAIISPWNYPFFLPLGEIAMALLAGNGVVFKPSEYTSLIGQKIQKLIQASGFPDGLMQTVYGDGKVGQEIIQNEPAKVFFTGSVATGKKIAQQAGASMIPVCLELGGKNSMIVLPDADIDFGTSAALWGSYTHSGQVCASIEKIFVHDSISEKFTTELKEKIGKLRINEDLKNTDIGCITVENQKAVYKTHLEDARIEKAEVLVGGQFKENGKQFEPTLVTKGQAKDFSNLQMQKEETFGPIVTLNTYHSVQEAIEKANATDYGLAASVITNSISTGEDVADKLEAGTVMINEVVYTAGIAETPWTGMKNSGRGVKHSKWGFLEFVQLKHVHRPWRISFRFKSMWWFPYTESQKNVYEHLIDFHSKNWIKKITTLPMLLYFLLIHYKKDRRF